MIFVNNTLPCNEDSSCDGTISDFVEDLYRNTRGQNMCKNLQENYCSHERTKSVLSSIKKLKKCSWNFLKFGIDSTCLSQVKNETGNYAHSHHTLSPHFITFNIVLETLILHKFSTYIFIP